MLNNLKTTKFHQSSIERKAALRSITGLLNCYCREYATPRKEVIINPEFGQNDWPEALKVTLNKGNDQFLLIQLPESQSRLLIRVKDLKQLGQCRYTSAPYLKKLGSGWLKLDHHALALHLLQHLAVVLQQPFNTELLDQIYNSFNNSQLFLAHKANIALSKRAQQKLRKNGFITSEQDLLWGHAWHPTPKSREGILEKELLAISPEVGANFQLHFLAVKETLLMSINAKGFDGLAQLQALSNYQIPMGYKLLPCHPYQLNKFYRNGLFQQALKQGDIIDLDKQGDNWFATSSVRTLYSENVDFFLKFSLHVRLTNCVRKNSWYELESAIFLNGLIEDLAEECDNLFPDFQLMREPSSVTLDLSPLLPCKAQLIGMNDVIELREAFGLLLRYSSLNAETGVKQSRVAAALFADNKNLESSIVSYIEALAVKQSLTYDNAALLWFACYIEKLIHPVFYYFFKLGFIFEPHLQNTVIDLIDHQPSTIQLRDLEGTKLVNDLWPESQLEMLSNRAKQSINYTREQGWKRIAYCTLINNISEAIYHLSGDSASQELKMWQQVSECIANYQDKFGEETELNGLLSGEGIPCKCNFMTRLLKQADRQANYVVLTNPMRKQ